MLVCVCACTPATCASVCGFMCERALCPMYFFPPQATTSFSSCSLHPSLQDPFARAIFPPFLFSSNTSFQFVHRKDATLQIYDGGCLLTFAVAPMHTMASVWVCVCMWLRC
uniref:Putative secreted peptide n=1 Tax=Anopheles braziliensis TaxID=58242 RepID=A0A2M3ZWJ3_9DIPT